jgi:hypothetical protein
MLWHYSEIIKTDPQVFAIVQLPEYIFTWSEGEKWISMWVTNNISEREESFFKFVRTLDLGVAIEILNAKGITEPRQNEISELVSIFCQELFTAKMRGELPTEYLFNN